ncbi:hypothetical protein HDU79_000612 [Rhizoclosmatium sp. JEL0117]|nr:hypothetical protein HDU79_000612 [Rhizoclosmatium sp. JEL0117]
MVEELRVKKEASDYFHSKLCFDSLSATNHHQSETIAILQAKLKKVQTDLVEKDSEIQQIQFHQNCLTTESASSKIIIAFLEDKVAFFRKEVPKHQGRLHAAKKNISHTPRTAWTLSLNNKLTNQITQIRRDWAMTSTTFQRKIGKITGKLTHTTQLKSQLETRLKAKDKEVAMLKILLAAVPEEIMAL